MNGPEAIKYSLLFLLLFTAAFIDIREMRIPNWLLGIAMVLRILLFAAESFGTESEANIQEALFLTEAILLVLALSLFASLSRRGLGFGDVKLMGTMALYQGVERTLVSLFFGLLMAACISLPLLAAGKIKRKDKLPLAPFFLMGYMWILLRKGC